ncbi:hypothetical protein HPB50_027280 [Hyalomma asiaticum]|uniref:Uncharacterized protein n=1 Tax=Hyalomma asiaticum TaxID=266040 RepID=A0ACB7TU41_HYAAI|nr:hypothetical protein HPB50_027280 [Hyalomma asiaticum]
MVVMSAIQTLQAFQTVNVSLYLVISQTQRIIVTTGTSDGVLSLSGLMSSTASKAQNINAGPDSVLAIICSSGSSGLPKGVQLTHRNVIAQMISMRYHEASIFQDSDVGLCSACITHVGGFWFCFGFLGNGCKVVLVDTSDFTTILSAIEKHRATSIVLYPMLLLKLSQHLLIDKFETSSLTKLMVAGGTVTGHLLESVAKKLKLKGIIQGRKM